MAWLAVDKSGLELIGDVEPSRWGHHWSFNEEVCMECQTFDMDNSIELPEGTIEKILGYKLKWEDSSVEIKQTNK